MLGAYHVAYRMVVAPDGRFLHPKNDHPVRRPSSVLGAYHVAYRMVVAPDGRFLHPKNDHPVRRPSGMLQWLYFHKIGKLLHVDMSISVDSPSDETLNRGPLALLLWRQYEFSFGIDLVQFSIFNIFSCSLFLDPINC